ncbi:hypothetical protein DZC52_06765 [Wenzhouxiangella sediminis]|uniref:Sporulation stage II protein D amidase enhancer LytB N-terminal domain-containing protein n=1 Tax=Wenzhouxiangella sediminis TaxID=1792836 RepID=A0A3E1K9B3_9GAMM|nr:hypothetical protein DZC52_06765 [Wenzhouxiangella sediminis]
MLLAWLPAASLASSTLTLRDAATGLGLDGQVTLAPAPADAVALADSVERILARIDDSRKLTVATTARIDFAGPQALIARAPGYRPLHTVLRPAESGRGDWTLLLDPLEPPDRADVSGASRLLIDGWVHDHRSFRPLAGVRIEVAGLSASTRTGADGYFALEIPAPRVEQGLPKALTVIASKPGYSDWTRHGLLAGSGRVGLQVALGGPAPAGDGHRQLMSRAVWPDADPGARRAGQPTHLRAEQPPASITVGFGDAACSVACCTGKCSNSCVMSLERYVERGLDNEWIASWDHDALAAGAVAYRSYGAWHVLNPPAHGAYDICSSACCQMNEPDTHSGSDEAVASTAGLMLIREGQAFRSEYSAQNNCLLGSASCSNVDLSCGDGFAGSPETGWPCLDDPVGAGRDCFGHGRGMSQWGNHYWTQGPSPRHWKWQLNHYYNDHGAGSDLRTAAISQVLSILSAQAPAEVVFPGQTFTIMLDAENLAASVHRNVLIGASLRRGSDPFIDDPANDRLVQLPGGVSSAQRDFDLPPDATAGSYDLWLALWIDVDRDAAISGDDLSQGLVVFEDALQVGEGVFRDRFEP